jgi:hypothetical protein
MLLLEPLGKDPFRVSIDPWEPSPEPVLAVLAQVRGTAIVSNLWGLGSSGEATQKSDMDATQKSDMNIKGKSNQLLWLNPSLLFLQLLVAAAF